MEKGMNSCNFALAPGSSKLQVRKNKIPTDEYGDYGQRHGRTGRNLITSTSICRNCHQTLNFVGCWKYGHPPSKKQKDHKVLTRIGQMLNKDSSDFTVIP